MTESYIEECYKAFSSWYVTLDDKQQKKFKTLWNKNFFFKEGYLDSFLFASGKQKEKLLTNPAICEYLKELDFLDLTEKDKDRFVYIWRNGVLEEMKEHIKIWLSKKD